MLPVVGTLNLEIDKQKLGDLFYTLKADFKEETERFSSMVFNLKHFFTQNSTFQSAFRIEMRELDLIEPYRFELMINTMVESAYLSFLIENAIKSANLTLEVVDSDLLIEATPDPRDPRGPAAVLGLISYFIYNKNKIAHIKPGERINLLSRLAVTEQIQDIDDKVKQVYEKCTSCQKRAAADDRIGNINPRTRNIRASFANKLRIENDSAPSDRSKLSQLSSTVKNAKVGSMRQAPVETNFVMANSPSALSSTLNRNGSDADKKTTQFEVNSMSKFSMENGTRAKGQPTSPRALATTDEYERCTCIQSYQNYLSTKLRITYLAYIRFGDGTNSLLKAETVWLLNNEPPVKLSLNLKNNKAKLNESLVLNLSIENNTTQELELSIAENSFAFVSPAEERQFGAVIMENKLVKTVFVPAYTRDSVAVSFTPIKSGVIQLEKVSLFDAKTKRTFNFACNYKILIS